MFFSRKKIGAPWVHVLALLLSVVAFSGELARVFQPVKKPVQTELVMAARPKQRRTISLPKALHLTDQPGHPGFFTPDWRVANPAYVLVLSWQSEVVRQFSPPFLLRDTLARSSSEETPAVG